MKNIICSHQSKRKQIINVKTLQEYPTLKAKLSDYFQGDYTAVIGTGMYRDDELREMKLDIPVSLMEKLK